MLGFLHKLFSKLCDRHLTMVERSHTAKECPDIEQLEVDLHRLSIEHTPSIHREKSPEKPASQFRLPPELMGEVFATVCHADFNKFHSDKNRHKRTTAFTLGQVSREWRDIVWLTPAIWSYVFLCLSLTRYDAQVELLTGWLRRSGVCPLWLNVAFQNEEDWSNKDPPMELINLLSSNSYRWRVINVVLPESWYPSLTKIQYNVPILVHVSTQPLWSDCRHSPAKRKRLTLFEFAPVLKELHLNGYYLSDVNIPWSQLHHFTLQHVYLDECFFGLSKTPNITICRIYTILKNDVNRVVTEESVSLPLLEEMLFFSALWEDTERLFSNLITPLLHTLEFSTPQGDLEFLKIPALLLQSKCHLLNLKLDAFTFTRDEVELLELLCNIPTLQKVEIMMGADSVPISKFFVDLLKQQQPTSTEVKINDLRLPPISYFLPDLETLTFSGPIDAPLGFGDLLLDVLRLRRNLIPGTSDRGRFPFFRLDIKSDSICDFLLSSETKDKLQELVDDGLHLSVVFDGHSWTNQKVKWRKCEGNFYND